MPLHHYYRRKNAALWRQYLLAVLLSFAGLYLLRYHIFYLNHLDVRSWGTRYLEVNHTNSAFVQRLHRFKAVICIVWVAALSYGMFFSYARLKYMGWSPDREAFRRMGLAWFIFLFTVVSYDPPDIDLTTYLFVNSAGVAAITYGLYRLPFTRGLAWLGRQAMVVRKIPTKVLCGLVALFVFTNAYQWGGLFFNHMPLTVDTNAQLVHAKMLLQGGWSIASHPLRGFFDMYMMVNNGRWYSQYPPGHVMLLALGTYLQHRSFVNPIIGMLTALAIYRLAKELYGLRVARIALVLSGMCVYLIMMSSEYMSNATSLLTGTLFLWAYFRMLKKPSWQTALWGGIAIGYCFITRPYSTLALSTPYIIYSIMLLMSQPKVFLRPLLVMAAGGGSFVLFQLYYNYLTTGNAFTFGYELTWGEWHNPLTHEAVDKLNDGELLKNFRENVQRGAWFNRMLFEWPVPALSLVALVYGWRGGRRNEKLLFFTLVSFTASCQVLPGNVEREWGPRLMYEVLGILVVLCARGLSLLPAFFRIMCLQKRPLSYYYGFAVILALVFYGFAFKHNMRSSTLANIYNFYGRGNNPNFYKYIVRNADTPALVFITGDYYQAVSFANPPMANSPIVFASDKGEANADLMDYYPNRTAYHAYVTRSGYGLDLIRRAQK